MKKFFLILMFGGCFSCLFGIDLQAQVLHGIVFADTKDQSIGAYDKQDFYNVTMELNTIASATRMKLKSYYFKDEDCSHRNLTQLLSSLQTGPNDVIFFYYSGHGVRSLNDASDYPQLCLGSKYQDDFYPLEKVLKRLDAMPGRLKIVIGDCCNSVAPGITPKDYEKKGSTVLTKDPINGYCNLFLLTEGTVIASGSQKGETSSTLTFKDGTPAGGAFTVTLLNILQTISSRGLNSNWEEVMQVTQEYTKQLRNHTPIYTVEVRQFPVHFEPEEDPATVEREEPQEEDGLTPIQVLVLLASEELEPGDRVEHMDAICAKLFASPDVKVEVIGRNGKTIVATERAQDFMLRICTAHNLVDIVELNCTRNVTGRYTYLQVHEIYRQD